MRYSISHLAFITAAIFSLPVATAQAQVPPGLDNGTYVLEDSSGHISPVSGNTTNGVPNAGYHWAAVGSVTNAQAAPAGSYNAGGYYYYDSTSHTYLTSGTCPGGDTCNLVLGTASAPSVNIPSADKQSFSNFVLPVHGGGTVLSNGSGQSTAVGPGGVTYKDGKGGSITLGGDPTINVTNGLGSTTNITNGVITSTTPGFGTTTINGGYVTINGGANTNIGGDVSTLTYVNAASATNGGAWVNNGLVVTGGASITGGLTTDTVTATTANVTTVNAGTVNAGTANISGNATVGGGLTVQGPTQLNGGVSVAPGQNVDFGGNVVSGVGTPIAPTDAANKAYVDTGLTNLLNTEKADVKKLNGGVAAAMALASPDRTGNQTGAVAFSESFWNGHTATGVSAIQQIYNAGSWDFSVGAGASFADTGDVGGRVTGQFAWGGSPMSLK